MRRSNRQLSARAESGQGIAKWREHRIDKDMTMNNIDPSDKTVPIEVSSAMEMLEAFLAIFEGRACLVQGRQESQSQWYLHHSTVGSDCPTYHTLYFGDDDDLRLFMAMACTPESRERLRTLMGQVRCLLASPNLYPGRNMPHEHQSPSPAGLGLFRRCLAYGGLGERLTWLGKLGKNGHASAVMVSDLVSPLTFLPIIAMARHAASVAK
jgi:hypothetical protein